MEVKKVVEGNVFIFQFEGNLILSDLEKARKLVKESIDGENAKNIVFDLENVDFIDSAGIGFIVSIFKSLKTKNGNFALASLKLKPKEVFKLTRLDKIIPIYDNTEAAKQSFV
jgi:anti-anti-sigma factor